MRSDGLQDSWWPLEKRIPRALGCESNIQRTTQPLKLYVYNVTEVQNCPNPSRHTPVERQKSPN